MKFRPQHHQALTDRAISQAKPRAQAYRLQDGDGLHVRVQPSGVKLWKFAYRFGSIQREMTLGLFPDWGTAKAREAADAVRAKVAAGVDPWAERTITARVKPASANTFTAVAEEMIARMVAERKSPKTIERARRGLRLCRSILGPKVIGEISLLDVRATLQPLLDRRVYMEARRLRSFISRVWGLARATGRIPEGVQNPAPDEMAKHLIPIPPSTPRPAIVDRRQVGALVNVMDGYVGRIESVVLALRFLMLTAARPYKEVCLAKWSEIDFQNAVWRIPGERMKKRLPHAVPLSRQALDVLRRARALSDGDGFIFAGQTRGRALSENTLNSALRRLGYKDEQTAHGLRATFSSLANESGLWNPGAVECQLAHLENNKVRAAYMRSEFWDERVRMAQWYADLLDELRASHDPLGLPPEMRERTQAA